MSGSPKHTVSTNLHCNMFPCSVYIDIESPGPHFMNKNENVYIMEQPVCTDEVQCSTDLVSGATL